MHGKLFLYSQLFGTMAFKELKGKTGRPLKVELVFLLSLCLSNHLARVHDEATTSDYGSDIGNQFNVVAGADEHDKKAGGKKARY